MSDIVIGDIFVATNGEYDIIYGKYCFRDDYKFLGIIKVTDLMRNCPWDFVECECIKTQKRFLVFAEQLIPIKDYEYV